MQWTIAEIVTATRGRTELASDQVASAVTTDSRHVAPGAIFVALRGERYDGHDFVSESLARGALAAVVHHLPPGADPARCIWVPDTLRALGDWAAWTRHRQGWQVVGLTGSSGKTTTKELIAAVCARACGADRVLKTRGNWNNLVGLPLTILQATGKEAVAVLEMGMNRFGEIRRLTEIARPNVGLITNIGLAHAEGVGGTQAGVARAKGELVEGLNPEATLVVNLDDEWVCRVARGFRGKTVTYGTDGDVRAHRIRGRGAEGVSFDLAVGSERVPVHLRLVGVHNVSNALAAAAVGVAMGFRVEVIAAGLEDVEPVEGRMVVVRLRNRVTVLDDTYNANPSSVEAALKTLRSFSGRPLVVLGQMLELGGESERAHRIVGERAAALGVELLVVLGEQAAATAAAAVAAGLPADRVHHCRSHAEAAQVVQQFWQSGDTVLVKGSHGLHMEEVVRLLKDAGNLT